MPHGAEASGRTRPGEQLGDVPLRPAGGLVHGLRGDAAERGDAGGHGGAAGQDVGSGRWASAAGAESVLASKGNPAAGQQSSSPHT